MRLLRWLGLQIRSSYFNGETRPRPKVASDGTIQPVKTSYWNASFGLVINLKVFQ